MNEEENLKVVQTIFGGFTKGEISSPPAEHLTEDVEWIVSGVVDDPFTGIYRGREKVQQAFAMFSQIVKSEGYTVEDYIAQGDKVVVVGRERIYYIPSERSWEGSFAYVITLRDGKIAKFHVIYGTP